MGNSRLSGNGDSFNHKIDQRRTETTNETYRTQQTSSEAEYIIEKLEEELQKIKKS